VNKEEAHETIHTPTSNEPPWQPSGIIHSAHIDTGDGKVGGAVPWHECPISQVRQLVELGLGEQPVRPSGSKAQALQYIRPFRYGNVV